MEEISKQAAELITSAQKFLESNGIPLKIHLEFNPYDMLNEDLSREDLIKFIDLMKHVNFYTKVG